jgi:hypothetical protein
MTKKVDLASLERVKNLYDEGRSIEEMAVILGVTRNMIWKRLTALGLKDKETHRTVKRQPISAIHVAFGNQLRSLIKIDNGIDINKVRAEGMSKQRLVQILNGYYDVSLLDMMKLMRTFNIDSIHKMLDFLP